MTTIVGIFTALANVASISKYVYEFASLISVWYVEKMDSDRSKQLADSIALTMRAKTSEDRIKASAALRAAMSRPRTL